MEANLYIDVTLLAVALSLHVTKRDRRLVLLILVGLFGHILLTSDVSPVNIIEEETLDTLGAEGPTEDSQELSFDEILDNIEPEEEKEFTHKDFIKSTVSSGVFGRQISTPQTMLTSSIFPKTSAEANGKLADSRGSFFNSLVS